MISIEQGKFSDHEKEEEGNPEKTENFEQIIEKDDQSKKKNLDASDNNNKNDEPNEQKQTENANKMELEKENTKFPSNENDLMDIEKHEEVLENPENDENNKKTQKDSLLCKLKVASVEESKFTNFELNVRINNFFFICKIYLLIIYVFK